MFIKYTWSKESKFFTCFAFLFTLLFAIVLSPTAPIVAQGCEYWIAPTGSNSNPGTFSQPWATLEFASNNVPDNNCIVWVKSGLYVGTNNPERRFNTMTTFKAVEPYTAVFENDDIVLELDGARNIIFDGFVFRHSGPGASNYVVIGSRRDETVWLENITFRNNIFHDSYDNDLLKIHDGSRFITIEGNIFFNQGDSEQHMDINSVTDVIIQDNILFNDFPGSGRPPNNTKAFIVIKDSNEGADGLLGSERITVRRNIFMNWEGDPGEQFIKVGNDGKPYYEAKDVQIENNLFIGNTNNETDTILGVRGSRDVTFANNTVTGNLPADAYALRVEITGDNLRNDNIFFYNNIWSDATGTMGVDLSSSSPEFATGDPAETLHTVLDNNLYWNGGAPIPPGDFVTPLLDDAHRLVANPLLNANQAGLILPHWNGSAFLSGSNTIQEEFVRLVELYGRIPTNSPAVGQANPAFAPTEDILGHTRGAAADMGAYEAMPGPPPPPPPTGDFLLYLPFIKIN